MVFQATNSVSVVFGLFISGYHVRGKLLPYFSATLSCWFAYMTKKSARDLSTLHLYKMRITYASLSEQWSLDAKEEPWMMNTEE